MDDAVPRRPRDAVDRLFAAFFATLPVATAAALAARIGLLHARWAQDVAIATFLPPMCALGGIMMLAARPQPFDRRGDRVMLGIVRALGAAAILGTTAMVVAAWTA